MQNSRCRKMSSNVASPKFSPIKEKVLIGLLGRASFAEAADSVGVNERTIQRWLKEPEFQKRLSRARDDIYLEAMDSLRDTSIRAAKKLGDLVDSPSEKTALKACELIQSLNRQITEEKGLVKRIEELEKLAYEKSIWGSG